MKVIYEDSIDVKVDRMIENAKINNKKIEKIILTKEEHDELREIVINILKTSGMYWERYPNEMSELTKYKGITIEKEVLPPFAPANTSNKVGGMVSKESCPNGYK
jgi:hypothetical protein